jgi:putative membrane protein
MTSGLAHVRAHLAMQVIVWILRFVVVLLLVWFAVKNAQPVTIHGLLEQTWEGPLVFVLLIAFVGGMVIGLLAWVPTVMRQRREIARLRKSAAQLAARPAPPVAPGTEPPVIDAPDRSTRGQAHGL